jgi:pimeloyl-ACP methyl ester carboxylesterase
MPYAQAGEVRLYYESFGRGVPFLFVSDTGWPGEPWKLKQVPAFTDRYQVIVYDHRGVGKSDAPAEYYSTRQFAQDAANLLDTSVSTSPLISSVTRWEGGFASGLPSIIRAKYAI